MRFYYVEEKNKDEAFGYDYRELNLTCNYTAFIGENQRFGIYGMLGFLSTYGRKVTKNATDTSEKFVERVGITAGFGLLYQLGRFTPYIESRSVTAGSEFYLVHSLGLTYSFGKRDD